MIGLVSATGMMALRGAYGAAGDALVASATALQRADTASQRLPWMLGRSQVLRSMDAQLHEAGQQARGALVILDGVQLEPGAGAESLEQVRAGVRTLIDQVETRQAIPKASERWRDRSITHATRTELTHRGEGLQAIGADDTHAWSTRLPKGQHYEQEHGARPHFDARRLLVELDPAVAERVRPYLPQQLDQYQSFTAKALLERVSEQTVGREILPQHTIWQLAKKAYRAWDPFVTPKVGTSDLRRIVDELARHRPASFPRPAWLDEAASDSYLTITPDRAADLVLMSRATSREDVELHLAHTLVNQFRGKFGYDLDEGVLMTDAARRLPGGLGAHIPDGVELDEATALQWSREVRSTPARALAAERTPDATLVHHLLQDTAPTNGGILVGNALVARELLDSLDGGSTSRRQLVNVVRERLDDFLETSERGWHPEYAKLGRAEAAARLLARVDAEAPSVRGTSANHAASDASSLQW